MWSVQSINNGSLSYAWNNESSPARTRNREIRVMAVIDSVVNDLAMQSSVFSIEGSGHGEASQLVDDFEAAFRRTAKKIPPF